MSPDGPPRARRPTTRRDEFFIVVDGSNSGSIDGREIRRSRPWAISCPPRAAAPSPSLPTTTPVRWYSRCDEGEAQAPHRGDDPDAHACHVRGGSGRARGEGAASLARGSPGDSAVPRPRAALAAGYIPVSPCETLPGSGAWRPLPNPALARTCRAICAPELLLFAPTYDGWRLVGVEYFSVALAALEAGPAPRSVPKAAAARLLHRRALGGGSDLRLTDGRPQPADSLALRPHVFDPPGHPIRRLPALELKHSPLAA